MSTIAKLFMSGRSQAIRLPARLRLAASEVLVEQIGTALWVHPCSEPASDMGAWLAAFYASTEPLPENFLAQRNDAPPQVRDWN
mgnify:CR=1 FL=1